ncbi:MAG: class II fructose-bisphosphate aldolase [Anaerolineales bacterium]|nr:class II fructose-bisphosphate aldolase [Anaerolineales bacterium]
MKKMSKMNELLDLLQGSMQIENGKATVKDIEGLRQNIDKIAAISALEDGRKQSLARYLTRLAALEAGIYPASINDLYLARGRGEIPSSFTVPAMNLRALSFEAARSVFRAAKKLDVGAFIFEIARSEIGYTDQRPSEYATNIFAAAIVEGYTGPVFIQGDHFQVSAKRYAADAETELQIVYDLIDESINAGFFNIDIDTSTLVDLSQATIPAQQALNSQLSAMYTAYIRSVEPKGVTISVGGEIGEVGGQNSTEPELRAYMDGFQDELEKKSPGTVGLSKISIQTGTSHGGVVLPDGTIKEVSVDFNTLLDLSRVARKEYGMAGAVQHGASTLPEDAFGKFVESEACEVHLATNFQNMLFDRLPDALRQEMYAYLDEKHSDDRKADMTDEQFYYKTRKNAIGKFKAELWNLDKAKKDEIGQAWEDQFSKLFTLLAVADTRKFVDQTIKPVLTQPDLKKLMGDDTGEEDVSDLAD